MSRRAGIEATLALKANESVGGTTIIDRVLWKLLTRALLAEAIGRSAASPIGAARVTDARRQMMIAMRQTMKAFSFIFAMAMEAFEILSVVLFLAEGAKTHSAWNERLAV
jgi:hypothetical protein